MPHYLSLIKVSGNKTKQLERGLKALTERSGRNVKVFGSWTSFGQYDGFCMFQAENEQEAANFVTEHIREIEGVVSTETLVAMPQAEFWAAAREK
jgi:DNA-binding Lrp family transcriptional regulator